VRDAGDTPPTVPFWLGEAPARTAELSEEVSALRAKVDELLAAGDPDGARSWLMDEAGVDTAAATMIVDYLAVGRAALGAMPTQQTLVLERFFDDTGGMQLVVHSPYGARVNRSLGLALRKKFCRTFNFELQTAATDDAIVLSLGPHHSFPLDEVPRYVSSRTVADTLEHAILDAPMFQARWRWNLNRSLMVLRFRGGRRNPPPIQRMESDDLLAAVFPQAAACQDNITGPIEIPDHVLVRQTIDDTLHEALDVDGVTELLERIESGDVKVHCIDTTEASVLSHEIITARPYAYLDDEGEIQNRRTSAVVLRRGLAVDLHAIGALDPAAVDQVHDEITPLPTTADDLADLLSSLVVVRARDDWRELVAELSARGRVQTIDHDGGELWCATEAVDMAREALDGDETAIAAALRGHLEISGITTVDGLAEATMLTAPRVTAGLMLLQQEGFAMQGHYTPASEDADTGSRPTEWIARRLLARMHSYSRRSRRARVEPVTAQDFMRFLLRWQHVAPGTQLGGEAGLVAALEQLQGSESAAVAWEPELLAARLRRYEPAWLDNLCHDGEVAWLRLTPRAGAREADGATPGPPSAPSKATPIAVVMRSDLPWLLEAARGESEVVEPEVGATAEIVEVLRARGACFASELTSVTRRLPDDVERGLWDGVARGLIMSDGFGAIRARVAGSSNRRPQPRHRRARLSPRRTPVRTTGASAGRWSLVPAETTWSTQIQPRARQAPPGEGRAGAESMSIDRDELAEAVAEQLLHRWGVVFRDLAVNDSLRLPWREIQWALRRLEDRGQVRGGRFVSGFSGEQYALPAAVEQLGHVRKLDRTGERVTLNATDPLNLVGLVVPGPTVPAVRTNHVTYVDGVFQPDSSERAAPRGESAAVATTPAASAL
jgi:ATP-dependent helicase Lhr and Lhr-like helicase